MKYFGIIVLVTLLIIGFAKKALKTAQPQRKEPPSKLPYKKSFLFSKAEYNFYWKLKEYADKNSMTIFSKMRILDIIEVTSKDKSEQQTYKNKISKKHVDFLLCDKQLHTKLIIELDDYTHEREDRKERDFFVDKAFESAGINIIHIKGNYDNLESIINEKLNISQNITF